MNVFDAKPITIVTGHYGCGKTSLSLNFAIQEHFETIIDLDVVNPFFRSSDYINMLTKNGIKVISPYFANTNLDVPFIPSDVRTSVIFDKKVLIDAGGDDQGSTAVGTVSKDIISRGYNMFYVVNFMRPQTLNIEDAEEIMREIEAASHIKITHIINNTNLKHDTDEDVFRKGLKLSEDLSEKTGLPLLFSVYSEEKEYIIKNVFSNLYKINSYVLTPWEIV
jgi:hypothetical protein